MPRIRITVRRLMIAVAVVAVGLGGGIHLVGLRLEYIRKANRDASIARQYQGISAKYRKAWGIPTHPYHREALAESDRQAARYTDSSSRYRYAASHPWLPRPR